MSEVRAIEERSCYVCGQSGTLKIRASLPSGRVLHCSLCNADSIDPLPSSEQLISAYQNFDAGAIAREEFAAYVEQATEILRQDLEIAGIRPGPGVRFLDYGCGGGHFVKAAINLNIDAWGIDLDEEDAKFGRKAGLRIGVGDYRDLTSCLGLRTYSVILMMHVLEHVLQPREVLSGLLKHLEPGGVLIIRVPDQGALPSKTKMVVKRVGIKSSDWGYVQPPIHLHGYSISTFQELARQLDLDVVHLAKCSPLDPRHFPTTNRYWRNLKIHKQIYRLGRLFGSGGHLVTILKQPSDFSHRTRPRGD